MTLPNIGVSGGSEIGMGQLHLWGPSSWQTICTLGLYGFLSMEADDTDRCLPDWVHIRANYVEKVRLRYSLTAVSMM